MNVTAGNFDSDVINKMTVEWMKEQFTPEEWDILYLKRVEGLTFDEIGTIIAQKYRRERDDLTGSAIRYHYAKISQKCAELRKYL